MRKSKGGPKTPKPGKGGASTKDTITGTWTWDGGDIVTGYVKSGNAAYKTYFGVLNQGIGSEVTFSGYGDSNGNGTFDQEQDIYVGGATLNVFATAPAYSGRWDANTVTGAANGYVGNALAATAQGVGFWFL